MERKIRKLAGSAGFWLPLLLCLQPTSAQQQNPIVHDSEYYILDAQHGAQWAVEDKDLDNKLAELRKRFGAPPNIIHIMWDDTAVGDVGDPFIQKQRGYETPNINRKTGVRRADGRRPSQIPI